jgi:hypothetical protein
MIKQVSPTTFFRWLKWLDGKPLLNHIEAYRRKIFLDALYTFEGNRPRHNLVLGSRAKKNWKTGDLVFAALYKLVGWQSDQGNQCYILATRLDLLCPSKKKSSVGSKISFSFA